MVPKEVANFLNEFLQLAEHSASWRDDSTQPDSRLRVEQHNGGGTYAYNPLVAPNRCYPCT